MIERQPFGRTQHLSTRTILGAAAFGGVTQDETDATMELALSHGLNHVDTAPTYGESELRLGSWIRRHGRPSFLATKTIERTATRAREEIHRSLERLCVDHVDLLQLHYLVNPQEWELALGPGGALEAIVDARAEGLVRFIGVTGHDLPVAGMHLRALERFDFDSVLLPFNFLLAQDPRYLADFNALVATCRARGVAVQTIKSLARGPWGDKPQRFATWYEPLDDQAEIDLAVHWLLGHPDLFLNTAGDIHILPGVLSAADRFRVKPTDDEMRAQVERLGMSPLFT